MEDIVLKADLDDSTSLYVSPVDQQTYEEHVDNDVLGGLDGYFIFRSRRTGYPRLEILAKAPTFEMASELFDMIVVGNRGRASA